MLDIGWDTGTTDAYVMGLAEGRNGTVQITKEYKFDAAHWLPNVPEGHPCGRMHGHTYHIIVGVSGQLDEHFGWVIDYGDISAVWKKLETELDHHTLNDVIDNPTAERLALFLYREFDDALDDVRIDFVTVKETESSTATIAWEEAFLWSQ